MHAISSAFRSRARWSWSRRLRRIAGQRARRSGRKHLAGVATMRRVDLAGQNSQPSGSTLAKMKGQTLVSSALFVPVRVSEMFDDVANGIVVLEGQQRAGRFDPDHVAPGQ